MWALFVFVAILAVTVWYLKGHLKRRKPLNPEEVPTQVSGVLKKKVQFYQELDKPGKRKFEKRVKAFLKRVSIKGVDTGVNDEDRILVAASAMIPVFGFPEWEYSNLSEVLLYPNTFNKNFETEGKERNVLGMVGWGFMNGTMTLSKPSLHMGFSNKTDKHNVGIHEFVHLIDKLDGATDGVPDYLVDKAYAMPWLEMMHNEMEKIREDDSDINPYGLTNEAEFYSVASEYFFERPGLFKKKHPKIYEVLTKIFKQDPAK